MKITNTQVRAMADALKDIVNAASAGVPYTPDELMSDSFEEAMEAASDVDSEIEIPELPDSRKD